MANNKIVANGETLIDLTADTVTAGTMVSGTTAHDRSGASITGTFDPSVYVLKAGDTMSGPLNFGTTGKISETELKINGIDLLTEFKAHTQYFAAEITANSNLKTTAFLNAGRYVCRQTTTAATLSNCPVSIAFNMDVDYPISLFNTVPSTWGYVLRTITTLNGQQWIQYVAIDGNGTITWNDWVQLRASTDGGNVIKQIRTNDANEYQLLFSEVVGRDSDTQLSRTRKNECLYYKPSSGELHLERASGITSNIYAYLIAGNNKIAGTDTGANAGVLRLYGQKQYYAQIADTENALTANRTYTLPNKDGELAILQSAELNVENRNVVARGVDAAKYIGFATKAGGSCYLHYSAAGNHGILSSGYESSLSDTSTYTAGQVWVIERLGASGNVVIPNWSSKGSASKPVYFNSSGYPVEGNETTTTSKAAASGGTDLSLVTTGEKYTWNSKTSNTGTVTSVAVSGSKGISISGSPITSSGTVTVSVDTTSGTATRNTTNTSSGTLTYVRYGKVVYIYGDFSLSTSSTDKTVFTGLPAPEKANCYITSLGPTASDGGSVFKINSSGQLLTALRTAKTGNNYISATYIADY